jgi:hypothetical protein
MTVILQGPRARLATVPVLFRASDCLDAAGIFALGYGRRLAAALTRASTSSGFDQRGRYFTVPNGAPCLEFVGGRVALLLQRSTTNLVAWSEDFGGTSWLQVGTPLRQAAAHTTSGIVLDLLEDDDASVAEGYARAVTVTGDGEKALSCFVKAGTASQAALGWWDLTAGTWRHRVNINFAAGVPSVALSSGAGRIFPVRGPYRDGVYRVGISAENVVAANTNRVYFYPAGFTASALGNTYAGGMQAENVSVPSGYRRSGAAVASRTNDLLTIPFGGLPRAATMLVLGVDLGLGTQDGATRFLAQVGGQNPRWNLVRTSTSGGIRSEHFNGVTSVSQSSNLFPTIGSVVAARSVLREDGRVLVGLSIDGGAEQVFGPSAALAFGAAWGDPIVTLGTAPSPSQFAYHAYVLAEGERSLAEMLELAGVG